MFPSALPSDEEHFRSMQKERHKNTWGKSINPKDVYANDHNQWEAFATNQWEAFATTFPHQAFVLDQLKSIYDNLAVVLRILSEKQTGRDTRDVLVRRYDEPFPINLSFASLDPFEYFQNDSVDYTHRKVFLELFVSLSTDRKSSGKGVMWREIGRSILENSYDAERASLVEELTSSAFADAINAVTGPSTSPAAIWRVRRHVVMGENALQKALARLRELLDEDKKKRTARSVEFERSCRAKSPDRSIRRDRRRERSWERSLSPSPVRERRVDFDDLPIREKRRARSPSESDGDSIDIIDERVEEA
jgi:hypothetical protein